MEDGPSDAGQPSPGRKENGTLVERASTPNPEEKSNWETLLAAIPAKPVVEVLLEYLLQEVSSDLFR